MRPDSNSVTLSCTLLLRCNDSLSLLELTCDGWSPDNKLGIGFLGFGLVEVGAGLDGVLVICCKLCRLVTSCGLLAVGGGSGSVLLSSWLVA